MEEITHLSHETSINKNYNSAWKVVSITNSVQFTVQYILCFKVGTQPYILMQDLYVDDLPKNKKQDDSMVYDYGVCV